MACCLTGPNHHVAQCWLLICEFLKVSVQATILQKEFENYRYAFKIAATSSRGHCVNSLWPSDAIWWHGSRSTLAQVMACCLTGPNHHVAQCWLLICEFLKVSVQATILQKEFENYRYAFKIAATSSRGHCVNSLWPSDAIWWHGSRSTLAQVMACCLTGPNHHVAQCWLLICEFLKVSVQATILQKEFKNYWYTFKIAATSSRGHCVNSLWPSGAIWRHGTRSTSAQVMACCLTAPSHYLNQCWLIISKVLWQPPESNLTSDTSVINH